MSLYGVQSFMFRLKRDPALQNGLAQRDERAFEGFPLEAAERTAILSGDIAELYRMGVHPLLLAPYSRYAGVSPTAYKQVLAPLKGTRQLKS
jgi:hypothetical protein